MIRVCKTTYKECLRQSRHFDRNPILKVSIPRQSRPEVVRQVIKGWYFRPVSFEAKARELFRRPLAANETLPARLSEAFEAIRYLSSHRAQFKKQYGDIAKEAKAGQVEDSWAEPTATLAPGSILVAHPFARSETWKDSMYEPFVRTNFADLTLRRFPSSILLTDFDPKLGTRGVILNKLFCPDAKNYSFEDGPKEVAKIVGTKPIWYGGPVENHKLVALHHNESVEGSRAVGQGVFVSEGEELLAALKSNKLAGGQFHLYSGESDWGPSQLEGELEQGVWMLATPKKDLLGQLSEQSVLAELEKTDPNYANFRAEDTSHYKDIATHIKSIVKRIQPFIKSNGLPERAAERSAAEEIPEDEEDEVEEAELEEDKEDEDEDGVEDQEEEDEGEESEVLAPPAPQGPSDRPTEAETEEEKVLKSLVKARLTANHYASKMDSHQLWREVLKHTPGESQQIANSPSIRKLVPQ